MKKILYILVITTSLLFVPSNVLATNSKVNDDNVYELSNYNFNYTLATGGFWGDLDVVKCGDAEIPSPIPPFTRVIVLFIKIAAPIVLIIAGMIDMIKAVTASDEKKIKEAQSKFVTRLIPAVAIFLAVTIVQLLVRMISDNTSQSESLSKCISCLISDEESCVLIQGSHSTDNDNNGTSSGITNNPSGGTTSNNFPEYSEANSHTSSITGIKFKLYNQSDSRWGSKVYTFDNKSTISDIGCMITAVAVVSSAHDSDITPLTVFDSKYRHEYPHTGINALSDSRFACSKTSPYGNSQTYVDSLEDGNILVIRVGKASQFTGSNHYMALLDVKDDGKEIFVGNSYGTGNGNFNKNGWFPTETVLTAVNELYVCEPTTGLKNKFNGSNEE